MAWRGRLHTNVAKPTSAECKASSPTSHSLVHPVRVVSIDSYVSSYSGCSIESARKTADAGSEADRPRDQLSLRWPEMRESI
jgi:hypothetical protein